MNNETRQRCLETGEWPVGYKGSVEERLDQMQEDFKALACVSIRHDDYGAAAACIGACQQIWNAQGELEKAVVGEARWEDIIAMQPQARPAPVESRRPPYQGKNPPG
jgi:hypothetical protein